MKKKLAVLVGGMYREFDIAYPTWQFVKNVDHDIYISTWSETGEDNPNLQIYFREDVTEERILNTAPNAIINIETDISNMMSSNKAIYHWKKLFNMAVASGNKYDYVIVTRPDITIIDLGEINEILQNSRDDVMYSMGQINHFPPPRIIDVGDVFYLGNFDYVRLALTSLSYYDLLYKDIHYHLAKHYVQHDICVEELGSVAGHFILRSTNRGHLDLPITEQFKISKTGGIRNIPVQTVKIFKRVSCNLAYRNV